MEPKFFRLEQSPERLQFLTDGVFAIVMTLLVLEIRVPEHGMEVEHLAVSLRALLPNIASFIISFIMLGFYWTAHHTQFSYIKKIDHRLTWLNLFYLLVVCFVPFSAALLGRFHTEPLAISLYACNLLVAIMLHYAMWRYVSVNKQLLDGWVDARLVRFGSYISSYSVLGYILAIFFAYIDTVISIIILALIPIPFIAGVFYRIIRDEL